MNGKGKNTTRGVSAAEWDLNEADDPADWNSTYSFLRGIDSSLRCDLCYVSLVLFKKKVDDDLITDVVISLSEMKFEEYLDSTSRCQRMQSCLLLGLHSKCH